MRHPWRAILPLATVLLASASIARGAGIDLSWNDCVGGPTASQNVNFVCGGDLDQRYDLFFQFRTPYPIPHFVAATAYVDLMNEVPAALAPFWHYEVGGCNRSPVSGVVFFDGIPASCADRCFADLWDGGSAGFESFAYGPDFGSPGDGHFVLRVERQESIGIKEDVNYYAFHLRFNTKNRALCPGCWEPVSVLFQRLTIESNDSTPPVNLDNQDKFTNCGSINGGVSFCGVRMLGALPASGSPCGPTPARFQTWGLLKSLYR
jgi:hypothetical protein